MKVVKLQITKLGKFLIATALISLSYFIFNLNIDNNKAKKVTAVKSEQKIISPIENNITTKKDNLKLPISLIVIEEKQEKITKIKPLKKAKTKNALIKKETKTVISKKNVDKKLPTIQCTLEIKKEKQSKVCTIKNIYAERDTIIKISWLNKETNIIERQTERVLKRYTNSIYDYRFIDGRVNTKYDVVFQVEDNIYTKKISMN